MLTQPKKLGRRRARVSHYGLTENGYDDDEEEMEEEGGQRKGYSYPPEFPVGKTVFLENDRRRAGWLPAVVSSFGRTLSCGVLMCERVSC